MTAKRVMMVDDSRMVHLQMVKLLEGSAYEADLFCKDGESAIETYRRERPDLVTMDILMPGMDGLEAAKAILEEDPKARIVMVSSLAYDDTLEEAGRIRSFRRVRDRSGQLRGRQKEDAEPGDGAAAHRGVYGGAEAGRVEGNEVFFRHTCCRKMIARSLPPCKAFDLCPAALQEVYQIFGAPLGGAGKRTGLFD